METFVIIFTFITVAIFLYCLFYFPESIGVSKPREDNDVETSKDASNKMNTKNENDDHN